MTDQSDTEKAAEDHFAIVRDRNLGEGARYKVKWSGLYDGQEIREAFLAGAAWAAPKWIKCSERLPMENEIKPDPRNFRDENGKLFMIYCPKCKLENYAPSVADGQCAWCGYKEEEKRDE